MVGVISGRFGLAATPIQTDADGRLIVRGEDQLHSFQDTLELQTITQVSGAGGYIDRPGPVAGEIWLVTHICAIDHTSATTSHQYAKRRASVDYRFDRYTQAFAAAVPSFHHQDLWMKEGDVIRVTFIGSLAADWCSIDLLGYIMTLET